ncbi:MAG TPA: DUF47 family protein [Longimicrobiaceae bacterium]|jgi:uncharacterized protein Yka (UPF0111/DUF47 family)|nr:DUF47 family protein [Longimicrobiaceae bacterium]
MPRLIPTDDRYYDLLEELAGHLPPAAALLATVLDDPTRSDELAGRARRAEDAADALARRIVERLDRTFVTPLDREDIHALAAAIDNLADLLEDAVESIGMFHLTGVDAPTREMAAVVVRLTQLLAEATAALKQPKSVLERTGEAHGLVEQADALYEKAVADAMEGRPDPLDVLKRKGICDKLQVVTGVLQDAFSLLESVAIKQG